MNKLQSAKKERARCEAAFAAHPKATWAYGVHHDIHIEPLTEPIANRIEAKAIFRCIGCHRLALRDSSIPAKLASSLCSPCEQESEARPTRREPKRTHPIGGTEWKGTEHVQ